MPYITQDRRKRLDPIVTKMFETMVEPNGDLNYILYAYLKRYFDINYNEVKNYCGELRQCATEIERRILAPYEDKKIEENGDVD